MKKVLSAVILVAACIAIALAQAAQGTGEHKMMAPKGDGMNLYPAAEIQWKAGPGSLPAGAKFAVLEGDPAKEGFFTMRLWFPDGYRIPPHWHPKVEHVTVISGTFHLGMGEKFDETATKEMPAGTFGYWPAEMRHFARAEGDTVVQLHGIGPWSITYVNPADDPRMKK